MSIKDDIDKYDIKNRAGAVKLLYIRYTLRPNSDNENKLRKLIEQIKDEIRGKTLDPAIAFRPSPTGLPAGEVKVFRIKDNGENLCFDVTVLDKGVIISGKAGSGKSTIIYHILGELLRLGIPVVIVAQKNDGFYERLEKTYDIACRYLGRDGNIPNPFALSVGVIAKIIGEVYQRQDSIAILLAVLQQCPGPISLDRLIEYLPSVKLPSGAVVNPDLKRSIYAVLLQLQADALGKSLSLGDNLDLRVHFAAGKSLIINTSLCGPRAEEFYIISLFELARQSVHLGTGLKAVIAVDEATQLVAKRGMQSSPLAAVIRLMRGSGVITINGTHNPSLIDQTIKANCHISVITNLMDAVDIESAAKSCSLSREQAATIPHLPIGTAIVRQASGYTNPVLAAFDPVPTGTPVDLNISASSQPVSVPVLQEAQPSDTETAILKDIQEHPFLGLAARCERLGINWRVGKKIIDGLVKEGLCTVLRFHLNQRGQPVEWQILTDKSYQRIGGNKPTTRGGTGITHALLQQWVKDTLAANGIESIIEARVNGKSVDIGIQSLRTAVEVVVSTEVSEPAQAMRDLESWQRVVVLCPNKEVLNRTKREFEVSGMTDERVSICLPKDLMQTIGGT